MQHGLGLCYKVSKTNITEVIDILSITEILPIVLEIKKRYFLFVIVYFVPGPVGFFIDKWTMNATQVSNCGNFNLDQMLLRMFVKLLPWLKIPVFLSVYNIQLIYEGILNRVYDSFNSNIVPVWPLRCSDLFILSFQFRGKYMIYFSNVSKTNIR